MPPKRSAQPLSQVQKTIKKSTRAVPRRVSIQNTQQNQIREQAQKKGTPNHKSIGSIPYKLGIINIVNRRCSDAHRN